MNSTKKIRNIIEINEDICNGCGLCITGCAEGALALVNGKAKLVSDIYCDGLGACLGQCPTGALQIIQRPAPDFDEDAALSRVREISQSAPAGCPGSQARNLAPKMAPPVASPKDNQNTGLSFWPIQLKLAPPAAPAFDSPVLILAADCTAFACPGFHSTFLSEGYPLVMGCPKLDDPEPYIIKVAAILSAHPQIRELRVPMMSVPCCGGLGYIATQACKRAGRENEIKLRTWIVTPEGRLSEENIR